MPTPVSCTSILSGAPRRGTANEHSAARTGIFHCVADEIAQDRLEQNGVAHDCVTGRVGAEREALAVCRILIVPAKLSENGHERARRRLDVGRMLEQAKRFESS